MTDTPHQNADTKRRFNEVVDGLVAKNARYAAAYTDPGMSARPVQRVAIVTCMDARLDIHELLGLELGDIHIIRNAGGVVTDDVIRSLTISQRHLGTQAVVLIHHTGCGMLTVTEDFRRELELDTGIRPSWAVEAFADLDGDVRQSMNRVRTSPFLLCADNVRGFVYDVQTGLLREVPAVAEAPDGTPNLLADTPDVVTGGMQPKRAGTDS
ncbi:MAG: carbonic anhydrase [Streptomycetaceae bacterium]|nr:carbonic anhydrase [Streptomycetaceae bacterium]